MATYTATVDRDGQEIVVTVEADSPAMAAMKIRNDGEYRRGDKISIPVAAHGMVGGSHERPGGPECRCGAEWDWWADLCTSTARQELANRETSK